MVARIVSGNNTNDIITSINFDTLYSGLVIAIKNAGTKNHPAIAICSLNIISNESTLSNNYRIKIDIIRLKPIFSIKYIITELNRF